MIKQIFSILIAFFRFYFYVLTKNPKQYDMAIDPTQGTAVAVQPLIVILLFGIPFGLYFELYFLMPFAIPLILLNMFYVHHIRDKGWSIIRQKNEDERQRERERREKDINDYIKRMMDDETKRQQTYYRQKHQRQRQQASQPKTNNNMANAMKLLGLNNGFTEKDVKKAYRSLSKVHHPDVGGLEANFVRLNKAYEFVMENM